MRGLNDCIKENKNKNEVISEKEIIEKIKTYLEIEKDGFSGHIESEIVQGLLDLYNKQKEEIEQLKNAEEYAKLGKETLLDTIHKQQKEIEELNSEFAINTEIHKRDMRIKELEEVNNCLHETNNDFISKDKIRDIIKCLDHEPYTAFDAYGELLYDTEIDIKQKLEKLL